MPAYDFYCDACKTSFELIQSMKEDLPTLCPDCGSTDFHQEFGIGIMATVIKSDNQCTLGTLAERNAKRMSQEEKDEIRKTPKLPAKPLPKGMKRVQKSNDPRWYEAYGNATPKEINRMDDHKKKKYIFTGEK